MSIKTVVDEIQLRILTAIQEKMERSSNEGLTMIEFAKACGAGEASIAVNENGIETWTDTTAASNSKWAVRKMFDSFFDLNYITVQMGIVLTAVGEKKLKELQEQSKLSEKFK